MVVTLTFPPPGVCLTLDMDPILDVAFHSSFLDSILTPPPFGLYVAFWREPIFDVALVTFGDGAVPTTILFIGSSKSGQWETHLINVLINYMG